MAPRKRSREATDIDGEVEIESASSRLQHGNKRSRIALAQQNGGSTVSDDDDDDEIPGGSRSGTVSDDEEDDELLDLRATQVVQKEHRQHRDNRASEQGVIEEVFCRNFMCHSKLRIKLGPLINFIIGHNGSGKSAVLTALTMCLGGKATATNRGASLKSLIKEGTDSATLAVKIKNQGDGSYKPDLYGRSITVERHFTRAGTSGFKLKNEHDKVISTKKADLDDILDFYAFQLDNPINVLTQDMARQFLSNSSPGDKYKFFIRGTQLEVLDADYKLMEENLDNIEEKCRTREQDISILKEKMEEAEVRKKRLEKTQSMSEKIERIRWQHAWAQVEEQEQMLEGYEQAVREARENVQEKTDAAGTVDGVYEGQNQSFESAKRTQHDLQEQLQPLQEACDAAKVKMEANKTSMSDIKAQERNCREEMKNIKKVMSRLEADIQKEKDILAGAEGDEHLARMNRLEELREEAEAKKQEYEEHLNGLAALQERETAAAQAAKVGQEPFQRCMQAVEEADGRLKRLQNSQGQQWSAFRPRMENLVRAINNETRFRTKPVGPMGKHIRILKPEWTSPIEKTMGGNLEAFIVTSKEDQNLLSQLMNRMNCRAPIMIGHPARLDVTGKEPAEDIDTMLRILDIDNDLVRNSIIINQAAEQMALIPEPAQAHAFMFKGAKPHNVRVTLARAAERGAAIRYEWSQRGASKASDVPAFQGPSRMTTDIQDQIRMQHEARAQAMRERDDAREAKRRLEEAHKAASANIRKFKGREQQLKVQYQQAEDEIEQQQALIDRNRPEDGKLQELERQLRDAKVESDSQGSSFQDIINAMDDLNNDARGIKAALDGATSELATAQKNVERAERRVDDLATKRQKALQEKNLAIQLIDQAHKEQTEAEGRLDTHKNHVAAFVEQAKQVSRRVEVPEGMTAAKLDARLDKLLDDRRRLHEEAGGTQEELNIAALERRTEYEEAAAGLKEMEVFAKELKGTLNDRHDRWKKFRRIISSRARTNFQYLLSERNFRGRCIMDHTNKELDIKVEPDLSKSSDAGRATKTLSGGEKSFSTICLLLSIWDAMGSPIRCLDEFDVFMDNVNRATSMRMMIAAARKAVGRQFVLITPQSMDSVSYGDDVKVNRMSDPERGQTTLEMGA
ncbi:Structural maintenance of chromosomes protein 6 [Saxophila tyrrhenica]|uniref:Structural maintenance of chromosomes protein 6 n=1 Tax=Saxophila tyrrhenica TaxID=1690608 RepID=A0AAV9PHF8_9PEZI|nr:Structural maintenance of chromosomes protein 6 [Saxophila tyrrhenica]